MSTASGLWGQMKEEGPEDYKLRIYAQFWYADPLLTLAANGTEVPVDFNKNLGFDTYSTFNGGMDWHFTKRQHLLFLVSPNQTSRHNVLAQTIMFQDKTFLAGSSVDSTLRTYSYTPGYRFDILHNGRGHLGIVAQINILDVKGTIAANVLQPGSTTSSNASGSIIAPIPVFGPDGRLYFGKNRVFIDANIKGMYFFGYGNFISTEGSGGIVLHRHVDLIAGYQMGSHLAIHGTADRASARLTQRGPTAGLEFNF